MKSLPPHLRCAGFTLALVLSAAVVGASPGGARADVSDAPDALPPAPETPPTRVYLTLLNQQMSVPFSFLPFHPGLSLGIDRDLVDLGGRSALYAGGRLQYYYHDPLFHSVSLSGAFGLRLHFVEGFYASLDLAAGASTVVLARTVYRPSGDQHVTSHAARVVFTPSSTLALGYRFDSVDVFAAYQFFVDLPFAPANGFAILPHTAVHVGAGYLF